MWFWTWNRFYRVTTTEKSVEQRYYAGYGGVAGYVDAVGISGCNWEFVRGGAGRDDSIAVRWFIVGLDLGVEA